MLGYKGYYRTVLVAWLLLLPFASIDKTSTDSYPSLVFTELVIGQHSHQWQGQLLLLEARDEVFKPSIGKELPLLPVEGGKESQTQGQQQEDILSLHGARLTNFSKADKMVARYETR